MSEQAMLSFVEAAANDAEIAAGMVAAVGDKEGLAASEAVAAYATSKGYDVSAADADKVRVKLADALDDDGNLSDESLEDVAGGAVAGLAVGAVATILAGNPTVQNAVTQGLNAAAGGVVTAGKAVVSFFKKW